MGQRVERIWKTGKAVVSQEKGDIPGRYAVLMRGAGKSLWFSITELTGRTEAQVKRGAYLSARVIPTFADVAKEWLKHKKPFLRITAWEVCEGHTRNHFADLDPIKVDRITTATVEKWIRDKQASGAPSERSS